MDLLKDYTLDLEKYIDQLECCLRNYDGKIISRPRNFHSTVYRPPCRLGVVAPVVVEAVEAPVVVDPPVTNTDFIFTKSVHNQQAKKEHNKTS